MQIRRHALVILLGALLTLLAPASASAAALGCAEDLTGVEDRSAWNAEIVAATNAHRASMGLVALTIDPSLGTAATWKARDMARRDYFSHDDPPLETGGAARTPWVRLTDCGYSAASSTRAENIAAGQSSGQAFVTAWLNSTGHRANIENPALRYIGVGTAYGAASTYRTYSVQMFSSQPSSTPPPAGTTPPPGTGTGGASGGGASTPTPPETRTTPFPGSTATAPTALTLVADGSARTECPGPGIATYVLRSVEGELVVEDTDGCLRLSAQAPAAGTSATTSYVAIDPVGRQSDELTLVITIVAPRILDTAPERTSLAAVSARIVRSRCAGRWAVRGWCTTLVARATLLGATGRPLAGRRLQLHRHTAAGRFVAVAAPSTDARGRVTVSTRLRPPARGTAAWLARTARSVRVRFAGTTALAAASRTASVRQPGA